MFFALSWPALCTEIEARLIAMRMPRAWRRRMGITRLRLQTIFQRKFKAHQISPFQKNEWSG